jgi:hypothetical protein
MEPVSPATRLCVNANFDSGNIICKSAADPSDVQVQALLHSAVSSAIPVPMRPSV